MNFEVAVRSREHRTLRHAKNYQRVHEIDPSLVESIPPGIHQNLLGIYFNEQNTLNGNILVSTVGLFVLRDNQWIDLPYGDIRSQKIMIDETIPISVAKRSAEELRITTYSGDTISILVRGGIWTLSHFLMRVRGAYDKYEPN